MNNELQKAQKNINDITLSMDFSICESNCVPGANIMAMILMTEEPYCRASIIANIVVGLDLSISKVIKSWMITEACSNSVIWNCQECKESKKMSYDSGLLYCPDCDYYVDFDQIVNQKITEIEKIFPVFVADN